VKAATRRQRLNKALTEMPTGIEFTAADVQEIMAKQYKRGELSTRAIGFLLAKTDGVSRMRKRSWIKSDSFKNQQQKKKMNRGENI